MHPLALQGTRHGRREWHYQCFRKKLQEEQAFPGPEVGALVRKFLLGNECSIAAVSMLIEGAND